MVFEDDDKDRLVVRREYADLQCQSCHKINEEAALARGLSSRLSIKTTKDWVSTSESWICVSKRFKDYVCGEGIEGLTFMSLPGENMFVLQCNQLVATDESLAAFENHNLCGVCGRYREKIVGPLLTSLTVPSAAKTFFASQIANENVKVSYRCLFATASLTKDLRKMKFKGLSILEPF